MKTPTPPELLRRLNNHLIDLQLANHPHQELIGHVYARLLELEEFATKVDAINRRYFEPSSAFAKLLHPAGGDNA